MAKFYAVRKGRKPGIYTKWDDAKALVTGFSGAEYKSFPTLAEAEAYMQGNPFATSTHSSTTDTTPSASPIELTGSYAFVDGSFNIKTNVYGFGGFLMHEGTKHILSGSGNNPEKAKQRQIIGEIEGAMAAVTLAVDLGIEHLTLYYDYFGIENWVTGAWNAGNTETKAYRDYMRDKISHGLTIQFIHTEAHTGIEGNEEADIRAKQAVGLL